MNTPDSFNGAFTTAQCSRFGAPNFGGTDARMVEPWWYPVNGPYTEEAMSTAAQPGALQSLGNQLSVTNSAGAAVNSGGAVATNVLNSAVPVATSFAYSGGAVATNGLDFMMLSTGGVVPTADVARPLEVRRYYHWNKTRTAGAEVLRGTTETPSTLGDEQDTARTHTVPEVLVPVSDESEAIRATESEAGQPTERDHWRRPVRRTILSSRSLTRVAVVVAGQKRGAVGEEWRCHLLGESAHGLTQREQIRAARGFVWAAIRYRLQDATDLAWRPVDAVLKSRTCSNLFVLIPTAMVCLFILRKNGTLGVMVSAESVIAIGAILYTLIRVGRWWRDVKPAEPRARRVKGE